MRFAPVRLTSIFRSSPCTGPESIRGKLVRMWVCFWIHSSAGDGRVECSLRYLSREDSIALFYLFDF